MKVIFPNGIKNYENIHSSIIEVMETINLLLGETGLVLSHIIVDGKDVYDNIYQYLQDEIDTIQEIKLIVRTKEEAVSDLQRMLNEYLNRSLPIIDMMPDLFYQGDSNEAWANLVELAEGLQWINQALEMFILYSEENASMYYKNSSVKLTNILKELMEALNIKDTITIADLIKYEIMEVLTDLKTNVQ